MARILLWGILIVLLVRAIMRLTRGVLQGAGYSRNGGSPASVALVKDPVCGVFVSPTHALSAGAGPETKFFCSEKCRAEWKGRR
jgi:YHS domain-containing protein